MSDNVVAGSWFKNEVGEAETLPWKHRGQNVFAVTSVLQTLCTTYANVSRLREIEGKISLGRADCGIFMRN